MSASSWGRTATEQLRIQKWSVSGSDCTLRVERLPQCVSTLFKGGMVIPSPHICDRWAEHDIAKIKRHAYL